MSRKCHTCEHPKRAEIDKILAGGGCVIRDTAVRFGLDKNSVWRHSQSHLPESLIRAAGASQVASATSLLGRVERMVAKLEKLAENCSDHGTGKDLLAVARGLRPYHELLGRVSGEIANDKVTALFIDLGVKDANELSTRLALTRGGEDLSYEDAQANALETLTLVWHKRPDLRDNAMREMERISFAQLEPHTNGSTNGSP